MAFPRTLLQCLLAASFLLSLWTSCAAAGGRKLASRETPTTTSMAARHEQWMAEHGRVYKNAAEKERRFRIFKANVEFIESFNAAGKHKYWLGANQFADLTNDEFKARYTGFRKSSAAAKAGKGFRYENFTGTPANIDWRQQGAVTPVKDQKHCGCCWAFSAVAAMEGLTQITTGNLISLSEQELLDCDVHGQDRGCEGGAMDGAFDFIRENGGLTTEVDYPYVGADGICSTNKPPAAATISGYVDVPANSEKALRKAVSYQPVSVGIEGSGLAFQLYRGGVFTGECGTRVDHGVTAVGYGTAGDGTKYWVVKNSWGSQWGEDGYVKMQRDVDAKEGLCGIAMSASYPTA